MENFIFQNPNIFPVVKFRKDTIQILNLISEYCLMWPVSTIVFP